MLENALNYSSRKKMNKFVPGSCQKRLQRKVTADEAKQ